MGIIRGVTTNPTIMKKDGNTDIKKTIVEICELVNPYPVSVEVTTNDSQEAFEQAVEFSTWAENINIKITIHGPNGEPNLKLINDLSQQGIEVNVTAGTGSLTITGNSNDECTAMLFSRKCWG